MRRGYVILRGVLAVLVAALILVPAASAASGHSKNATVQAYGSPGSVETGTGGTSGSNGTNGTNVAEGSAGAQASGALPFTGVQLTIVVIVGAALFGSGLLLRSTVGAKARP